MRRTPGTDRRYPRRPEPLPLKILGRQDDFRSLTADCPATLTPEARRAARQQDAQTEDHLVADGQRPEAQHQPQGQDDGQSGIVSRRRSVITHLLPCPAICATICDSMAEQVNHGAASATMPAAQPHQYIRRPLRSREARTTTGASWVSAERRDPRADALAPRPSRRSSSSARYCPTNPSCRSTIETSQHCRIRRGLSASSWRIRSQSSSPALRVLKKRACGGSLRHLR